MNKSEWVTFGVSIQRDIGMGDDPCGYVVRFDTLNDIFTIQNNANEPKELIRTNEIPHSPGKSHWNEPLNEGATTRMKWTHSHGTTIRVRTPFARMDHLN
ncbi:hypothetical protein E3N88_11649 [Mikania micrantha]|uniref:Uncharacterized protein n=1 Tax=Mikania micrantha TaxID=192012 RepID=A0A5N6PF22_9ASTR|nr:hypothetical protein E3N88_11649 [Mikania micrantha]